MARRVELRRHTDSDGDVLTRDGITAAVDIGRSLQRAYDLVVSSGAQRATQTIACFLAGMGRRVDRGVVVDGRFRSEVEDRWRSAYEAAGSGDIESLAEVDPELVEKESRLLGAALTEVFERLPEGGRALIVGHSPMQEAAVYGLTGQVVDPIPKGGGVAVVEDAGSFRVEELDEPP